MNYSFIECLTKLVWLALKSIPLHNKAINKLNFPIDGIHQGREILPLPPCPAKWPTTKYTSSSFNEILYKTLM